MAYRRRSYRRKGKQLSGHQLKRTLYAFEKAIIWVFLVMLGLSLYGGVASPELRGMMLIFAGVTGLMAAIFAIRLYVHRRFLRSFQTIIDLRRMDPFDFEHYVANILDRYGFKTKVTKASGDWGVDIEAWYQGKKYIVQCKRYAEHHKVQSSEVRDFFGTMTHFKVGQGIFVTTSTFGPDAKTLASKHQIRLIDCNDLADMIRKAFPKEQ